MPKKSKLKYADGKIESDKPTSLDQIFGETTHNYNGQTLEEYEKFVRDLNQADLQAHAILKSILPAESRERTVQRLIKAYKESLNKSRPIPSEAFSRAKSKKVPADILKILSEGRG